jgi:RNA polymerase sigma-70 factor (ECF subfamily)
LEATAELLLKIQGGDKGARERLVRRFLPILRRWAHGRLPPSARDLAETEDLVQVTLLKALDHIETFEHRREGAFLAYLRRILLNSIRDEIRRVNRRPLREDLPVEGEEAALVVQAAGLDTMLAYERALEQLTEEQQEAVILRIEFGYSHQEIAAAIGSPTANAARMTVSRALVRLAEIMDDSTAA